MRGKPHEELTACYAKRITPAGAGKTRICRKCLFRNTDHPRRCGENIIRLIRSVANAGSPPQVRGKHENPSKGATATRITPAGAGKTVPQVTEWEVSQDHPRRCGENRVFHEYILIGGGSPPQVRGKPHRPKERGGTPGITPAGAGKTDLSAVKTRGGEDHPRRCGENWILNNACGMDDGITPAGAGKTFFFQFVHCILQDHPRRCGENEHLKLNALVATGSPPQVRGKPARGSL